MKRDLRRTNEEVQQQHLSQEQCWYSQAPATGGPGCDVNTFRVHYFDYIRLSTQSRCVLEAVLFYNGTGAPIENFRLDPEFKISNAWSNKRLVTKGSNRPDNRQQRPWHSCRAVGRVNLARSHGFDNRQHYSISVCYATLLSLSHKAD